MCPAEAWGLCGEACGVTALPEGLERGWSLPLYPFLFALGRRLQDRGQQLCGVRWANAFP